MPYDPNVDPNQFDYLRKKAKADSDAAKQEQDDALKRRFASIGQLNSGAAIKTSQLGAEAADRQAADAQNQIGFAEAQQKFQTSEREATQNFQAGQLDKQQQLSKDLFQQDLAFKAKYADLDNLFRDKEFGENQKTNAVNTAVAIKNAGISPEDGPAINEALKRLGIPSGIGGVTGGGATSGPDTGYKAPVAAPVPADPYEAWKQSRLSRGLPVGTLYDWQRLGQPSS